jgi:hypothetical protein
VFFVSAFESRIMLGVTGACVQGTANKERWLWRSRRHCPERWNEGDEPCVCGVRLRGRELGHRGELVER